MQVDLRSASEDMHIPEVGRKSSKEIQSPLLKVHTSREVYQTRSHRGPLISEETNIQLCRAQETDRSQ